MTRKELKMLQALPLEVKIEKTKLRIREWYNHWGGDVYVSFSGGKDSTVLLDIARQVYPDIEAVFVDTGLEYPEIREFVKSKEHVIWLKPEMSFRQVIKEKGYPVISKEISKKVKDGKSALLKNNINSYALKQFNGTSLTKNGKCSIYNVEKWKFLLEAPFLISNQCCDIMKKKPVHKYEKETGKKGIIGTMASESRLRLQRWLEHGCNAFDKNNPSSQPLSFWTEQDILEYIHTFSIPYAPVYGYIIKDSKNKFHTTGCNRTGCMFCMFGVHLESSPNRFEKMKQTHPKQYEYCMKPVSEGGLGLHEVLDFLNIKH